MPSELAGETGGTTCLPRREAVQVPADTKVSTQWRVTRASSHEGASGDSSSRTSTVIHVSLQGSAAPIEGERMPQLSTFRSSRSSSSSLDQLDERCSSLGASPSNTLSSPRGSISPITCSYESLHEPEVDYSDGEVGGSTGCLAASSLGDLAGDPTSTGVLRSESSATQKQQCGSPIYANFPPLPSPLSPPQPSPEDQPLRFLTDYWAEYDARRVGRKYYYNFRTGERSWKPPRRRNTPAAAAVFQNTQDQQVPVSSSPPPVSIRKGPPPLPPAKKKPQVAPSRENLSVTGPYRGSSSSLPREGPFERNVQQNGNSTFYYATRFGKVTTASQAASEKQWYSSTDDGCKTSQSDRPALHPASSVEEETEEPLTFSTLSSNFSQPPGQSAISKVGRLRPTPPPTLPLVPSLSDAKHARAFRTRSMILPEDFTLRGAAIAEAIDTLETFEMVTRQGTLNKTEILRAGKKQKKSWSATFVVLTNRSLFLYKDINSAQEKPPGKSAELQINLAGAVIDWCPDKSKRRNVFQLSTIAGQKVLLQDDNVQTSREWFDTISANIKRLPNGLGLAMGGWKAEEHPAPPPPLLEEAPPPTHQGLSSKWGRKQPGRSKSIRQATSPPLVCDTAAAATAVSACESGDPPSPQDRKNRIRDKLRHFFTRRPTLESLQEKGIFKDEPVFGCTLAHLCEKDRANVPRFVRECILEIERRDMTADGLYRASGNLSQVQKVRCHVNQDDYSVLSLEEDIHVLTGALKMFFRHMKEPLFPYSLFHKFLKAIGLSTRTAKLAAFRELLGELPRPNYDTLKYLLNHLLRVTEHSDQNRMHVQNLAIVFGPTLLSSGEEPRNLALDMIQQNQIIEFLLLEYSFLFL